jgi:hypothetical protein
MCELFAHHYIQLLLFSTICSGEPNAIVKVHSTLAGGCAEDMNVSHKKILFHSSEAPATRRRNYLYPCNADSFRPITRTTCGHLIHSLDHVLVY